MYSRQGQCLFLVAALFALNTSALGNMISTSMIEFTGDWKGVQWPPETDRFVSWTISLIPDKRASGGNTATDVEIQFAFEFTRDLRDVPNLDAHHLLPVPATNPYTGAITEGLSIHYSVPSQLGREGKVNAMFLS